MSLFKIILGSLLLLATFSCADKVKTADNDLGPSDQEKVLKELVKNHPDSLLLQDNLANFYQENEAYDKAIDIMRRRAVSDSLNDKLQEAIGFLYYENDDTTQAIVHYKKAYRLVPDKSYLIAMATLEAGLKNPIALQLADEIIKIDKATSEDKAYYVKGIYYSRTGEIKLALENFDNAIKAGYTFTPPYLEKALILMANKKYQEAVVTLDKGIAVQNNFPEAYYYKALSLNELGNKKASIDAFDMALLYDPNYTDAINDKQKYFGNK